MKEFNWNKFVSGKVAVSCDTKEKAEDFINKCKEKGFTWCGGAKLLDSHHWDWYRELLCYSYHHYDDVRLSYKSGLTHSSVEWFREENYKIIKWEL